MTRSVIERLLETFFRRWWLYLLPALLICALGASTVLSTQPVYRSAGTLTVNRDTLLTTLADVSIETPFTFESAASVTARNVNELLQSAQFTFEVADQAGLTTAVDNGIIGIWEISDSIGASPRGDTLVEISAETEDPELSYRLADATIVAFIDSVVESDIAQSQTAVSFYEELSASYEQELESAQDALDQYLIANPEPAIGERPFDEQTRIDRLTADVTLAQEQYAGAVVKAEDARLVIEQTRRDINQRLQLVDAPELPFGPEPQLRDMIFMTVLFVTLGTVVLVAMVAVATAIDRSVRTPQDLEAKLGVDVLAAVPRMRS